MQMAKTFRDLVVWNKAMALAESIYVLANALPDFERFGLAAQLRRSAVSIPSNIAEGHEHRSRADYRRFITIACGSLAELETQIELAARIHGIQNSLLDRPLALADETGRMLRAIERSLRTPATAAEPQHYGGAEPSALGPQPS
jgi:four helix bundle protein